MKNIGFIFCTLIAPCLAYGGNLEIKVSNVGSDLYKAVFENIYIHTLNCPEYAYNEITLLKTTSGGPTEITFTESGKKCDVKGVYVASKQDKGKYTVTIRRAGPDWYEILGLDMYIRTMTCMSLAVSEEAVLSLNIHGYGTLYTQDEDCDVQGVFSRLTL